MKWVKSFVLMLLTFFLLCGSFGMLIFKHSCNQEGVSVSYFICADKHKEIDDHCQASSDCCIDNTQENNCCHDDISYLKIKLDFVSFKKIAFVNVHFFQPALAFEAVYNQPILGTTCVNYNKKYPPPFITDNEILIRHHVFRI